MSGKDQAGAQRGTRLLPKVALLVVSLGLAVGLGEAAVRVFGLAPKVSRINPAMQDTVYRVSDNPLLGYVFKKGYRNPDADLETSYPAINAHGFRDAERELRKPEGVKRVIVLGDSVVVGHLGIRSEDDTISRETEKRLRAAGKAVEVLNMSVTGYCMLAEVELLETKGLAFSPDVAVFVFVINDYVDANMELGRATPPAAVRTLFLYSHLFRYAGVRFNWFRLRTQLGVQELSGEWVAKLFAADQAEERERIMNSDDPESATIRKHLEAIGAEGKWKHTNVHTAVPRLAAMAKEHGFVPVIGIWPAFYAEEAVTAESFDRTRLSPAAPGERITIERLSAENGIPSFRFAPYFNEDYAARRAVAGADLQAVRALYTVGDGMHPTPLGAEVAAEAIARILEENPNLLEGRVE